MSTNLPSIFSAPHRPAPTASFEFLTNNFKLAASTIAAIYKDRWAMELFFKALKHNLKIKTFVGTSANAVKTQVWTALITMLMLRFMQLKSQWGWWLSNLVALLRMNLFTCSSGSRSATTGRNEVLTWKASGGLNMR
jgi:hypothetical protein